MPRARLGASPTVIPTLTGGGVLITAYSQQTITSDVSVDSWALVKPTGSSAALSGSGLSRAFTPDMDGVYTVRATKGAVTVETSIEVRRYLINLDFRTQTPETLHSLGDTTISRWGQSVTLSYTANGTLAVSTTGVDFGVTANNQSPRINIDLDSLGLDHDDCIRLVAQFGSLSGLPATGSQINFDLTDSFTTLAAGQYRARVSWRRGSSGNSGLSCQRGNNAGDINYNPGTPADASPPAGRFHMELFGCGSGGFSCFAEAGLADGLPTLAQMRAAESGSVTMVDNATIGTDRIPRYLSAGFHPQSITTMSVSLQRLWLMKWEV